MYMNCKGEKVESVNIKDLFESLNCTTKNKKVMEYIAENRMVHQWDGNFYFIIGTKNSMIKITKKKSGNVMTTY